MEDIDGTPEFDNHHPEAHLPPGDQVGEVDPVLNVQCNCCAISDLEENTAHTT